MADRKAQVVELQGRGDRRRKSVDKILLEEELTDRGHGRRIKALHSSKLAWVPECREWAHFNGQRWRKPADEAALALAQSVSDVMLDLRDDATDWKAFSNAAIKLQCVKDAKRALEAAKPMLLVNAEEFDAKAHLLNCLNGTLNLQTLELRPHDPSDRLTLITAAPYEANARLDLWDQVINYALPNDGVRDYVQRLSGLTLDGSTQLDLVLLLFGITRTAKGTIQGAIHHALGRYAHTAGLEDLALRDRARSGPRPELVKLQGKRMVSMYESSSTLRLDPALLKTISGSDPVNARDLYSRAITFVPQFTLWIATNNRPILPASDDAVWERLREIPFTVQIPKEQRDPAVRATLNDPAQAGAAVLAWAVKGLRRYHEDGLSTPETVTRATASYKAEMDVLADFASECLSFGEAMQTTPRAIRFAYTSWAKSTGSDQVTAPELAEWLRSKGCDYRQESSGARRRLWKGVGIVTDDEGDRR